VTRRQFQFASVIGLLFSAFGEGRSAAEPFNINTPGGPVTVEIGHLNPGGTVLTPDPPTAPGFRPPSIFSAPVPVGAGARALGVGGAFTAVADDATAASWNPAGLIQLEKPEFSIMARGSRDANTTSSSNPDYQAGRNEFDAFGLNYLSLALPFQSFGHNFVASANCQEAYDLKQRFSANMQGRSQSTINETSSADTSATTVQHLEQPSSVFADQNGVIDIDLTSQLTTHSQTTLNQILGSQMVTSIDFEQDGIIHSYGPALAMEITPKLAVGFAFNVFQDRTTLQSQTRAVYQATSQSLASLSSAQTTSGSYNYNGTIHLPPGGSVPVPIDIPISGSGNYAPFTDTSTTAPQATAHYSGLYQENNEFHDLLGFNGTLGGLWTVNRQLGLGFSLDLPWTAQATQTKTIKNAITATAPNGTILNQSTFVTQQTKDVSFDFPLYWAVGGVWRWNDISHTSLDVSETLWSSFSFKAEGEPRINPLDGKAYNSSQVDDCWSVRLGHEYLIVSRKTTIPLRAGLMWEQRPALGAPDNFFGVSVGTGISIGPVIVDLAYSYSWGNNVLGSLVPGQSGLSTDVQQHQVFLSCIYHF
jgi:long-subunit fatty acid transport protein